MIPEKIKIGWKIYQIKLAEPKQTLFTEGKECYGTIDYDNQEINLRLSNNKEQNGATLIHEVLHGIEDMYCMNLGEEVVKRLTEALYTVLKDNNLEVKKINYESVNEYSS